MAGADLDRHPRHRRHRRLAVGADRGLELVTGDGKELAASRDENPDVLECARLGLGALGVLTSVTFVVEPLFALDAHESADALGRGHGERTTSSPTSTDHVDMYWFPHTDRLLTKRNNRIGRPGGAAGPVRGLARRRVPRQHGLRLGSTGRQRPPAAATTDQPTLPRGRCPTGSSATSPHRVFTSPRRVVFREMEYAVPREVGLEALREVRTLIDGSDWLISFPVEVRFVPGDDVAALDRLRAATRSTSPSTPRADRPHRLLRPGSRRCCALRRAPALGQAAHPDGRGPGGVYPRWRGVPGHARPTRPDRVFANPYLERVSAPDGC